MRKYIILLLIIPVALIMILILSQKHKVEDILLDYHEIAIFAQDNSQLALFLETAKQMQEVNVLIRIRQNIPEKREEAESELGEALNKAEVLQKQNTLCDDGILIYLKTQANFFGKVPDIDTMEKFLSEIKSPMEEELLRLVGGRIDLSLKKAPSWHQGLENPMLYTDFFDHFILEPLCVRIIPIRSNSLPIVFDENGFTCTLGMPFIPNSGYNNRFTHLPYQLKTLGLYDKAWRSFYEHIDPNKLTSTHYSDKGEAAAHWFEAADCAYRAGEKRLGWNLLIKAAVFGEEETFEKVKKTAALWLYCEEKNRNLPPPEHFSIPGYYDIPQRVKYAGMKELEEYLDSNYDHKTKESRIHFIHSITPGNPRLRDAMLRRIGEPGLTEKEIRRECWDFIIDAYMKMNAHPRAWTLIDEYPREFENPKKLKKKLQDDWLKLVTPLIPSREPEMLFIKSVTVYGHQLYPDGIDPLDVTIPWAFPDGSVERAKQELQKALDELKAMQ